MEKQALELLQSEANALREEIRDLRKYVWKEVFAVLGLFVSVSYLVLKSDLPNAALTKLSAFFPYVVGGIILFSEIHLLMLHGSIIDLDRKLSENRDETLDLINRNLSPRLFSLGHKPFAMDLSKGPKAIILYVGFVLLPQFTFFALEFLLIMAAGLLCLHIVKGK